MNESAIPPQPEPAMLRFSETQAARICSLTMLVCALLVTVFVAIRWVPIQAMWVELDVSLPTLAALVIDPGFPISLTILALVCIIKELLIKNKTTALICNCISLAVALVFHQMLVLAVSRPLMLLIKGLTERT